MSVLSYRLGIVAVFQNERQQLLLFKRTGMDAWQFPQGGIDEGESPEEALFREVREETGCADFRVLRKGEKPVRYDFPETLQTSISKNFRGQEQHWFLCCYSEGAGPDLSKAEDKEFEDLRWADAQEALSGIVDWKQNAYTEGYRLLGIETQ